MNLEQKVFEEYLDKYEYTNKMKQIMTDLYMQAYHDGRHAERDRLVKSGFLIIDSDKLVELEQKCQDPCVGCIERADYLKIGCKANPQECKLKQEQLRAMEVRTWFKTKE